jgi:hypothetical protein
MRQTISAIAVGWFFLSGAPQAQSDWTAVQKLPLGTTVRVTAGPRQVVGALESATANELAVRGSRHDAARFERIDIQLVESFVGNPRPKRRGARNGALWSLILVVPATFGAEMGGMDRRYLPLAYCFVVCGGAALGAWLAEDAHTIVVYRR